jgi:hypothetical protein
MAVAALEIRTVGQDHHAHLGERVAERRAASDSQIPELVEHPVDLVEGSFVVDVLDEHNDARVMAEVVKPVSELPVVVGDEDLSTDLRLLDQEPVLTP